MARPGYDRQSQRRGIVHLGVGAFHRAQQARYTDIAMACGDHDWAITGVSLRSPQVRDAIEPQNGLFTMTERNAAGERIRLVGALREVLVADESPHAVARALADPDTHAVTLTVTEKGYCRRPDGTLDITPAVRRGHNGDIRARRVMQPARKGTMTTPDSSYGWRRKEDHFT